MWGMGESLRVDCRCLGAVGATAAKEPHSVVAEVESGLLIFTMYLIAI